MAVSLRKTIDDAHAELMATDPEYAHTVEQNGVKWLRDYAYRKADGQDREFLLRCADDLKRLSDASLREHAPEGRKGNTA